MNIPPPPAIDLSATVINGLAAGSVVLGAAMLLWGRPLGRLFMTIFAALAGAAIGPLFVGLLPLRALSMRIVAAVVLGLVAMIAARLLWSLLAGAIFGGASLVLVIRHYVPELQKSGLTGFEVPADVGQYAAAGMKFLGDVIVNLWSYHGAALAMLCGLPAMIALLLVLIRPRLGVIFLTCLLGASAMTAGLMIFGWRVWPPVLGWWQGHPYWPAIVGSLLMAAGMVYQYRMAILSERQEDTREGEPPPKDGRKIDKAARPDPARGRQADKS